MKSIMRRALAATLLCLYATGALASNAYITEFATMAQTDSGGVPAQIASLPPVTHQKIDFSAGAASAAAFNASTRFIRVHCDAACSIRMDNTATTTYMRIPTDGIEYFGIPPGGHFLSIIANP